MTQRLTEAIVRLRYRQIKALLDQGVNINNKQDDGRTPLMVTLGIPDDEKRRHMFRFLVHHGAEMLESDNGDVTIFQHCCRLGFLDLMEIILKKAGVSAVNMMGRDKHGRNALYHAVASEDVMIVNKVLDHINLRQQSVDVPDNDGLTPLLYARRLGLTDIADVLITRGKANPRICDRQMHMNAEEWAEAARRREQEEQAHAKKLSRERYMIFPPIDHATRRKEKISKMKSKTIFMPNLTTKNSNIKSSVSSPISSLPNSTPPIDSHPMRLPSLTQSNNLSQYPFPNGNDVDLRTKSIDSAITLLGLASQTADDKQYAQSFVSSRQHKPIGHAQSKSSNRHLQRTWATMMDAYSTQNTANFRKPAKAPTLPDISAEVDGSGQRTKMSTLAIIMRATRGGKGKGKNPRGKHKLNSISEPLGDGDHGNRRKFSRRKTSTTSVHPDDKSKEALSAMQEDESEWGRNKKKKDTQTSSQKQEPLPNITVS